MPLTQLSAGFQSLPTLPTSKLGPSCADPWVGGFVYVLGPCGSLQQTLLWGWEFFRPPQPPQTFTARGFEALFPRWNPGLHGLSHSPVVSPSLCTHKCETTQSTSLHFAFPVCQLPHLPGSPAATLPMSSPLWLPVFTPPTSLDECFFNSLVARLPYSLIFWQFWLFFVFILLLIVQESEAYLPVPPSCLELLIFYFSITVDIQHYISFRCTTYWLDIYVTMKLSHWQV